MPHNRAAATVPAARAGKEFVGQEITDNPNAQFISRVTLAKQRQDSIHSIPIRCVVI